MDIVIVHTDFRLYWPVRLKNLTENIRNDNINLNIVEIAGQGSPYLFDTHDLPVTKNWHILFPDKKIEELSPGLIRTTLNRKLDELNPDILISGPIAYYSGAVSASWATRNYKKLIIFDDARIIDIKRPWWVDLIKKRIYSCVDAVFCPAPEWETTFAYFGFKREQLFFGVDVVDNKFWRKGSDRLAHTDYGNFGNKYLLSVGRQVPKKNLLFLLRAFSKFQKRAESPMHLVLIGEGTETEKIRNFVSENNLNELVHLKPFLSPEELKPVYHNASWFILPSKIGETWGLVVNEAMAAGLPVLVSNQAGCAGVLVKEGVNGFLFSPEKEDDLVELLLKVSNISEPDRRILGKKSEDIISDWGVERFCKGIAEAIKYVSSKSKVKPDFISRLIIHAWQGRYRPV